MLTSTGGIQEASERDDANADWNGENGGTDPPAEYILHICEFLRISVYELLADNVDTIDSIENIYAKLDPTDKQVVDIIFDKYREENAELSSSKIG